MTTVYYHIGNKPKYYLDTKKAYLPKVTFKETRAFLTDNGLVYPFLIRLPKVTDLQKVAVRQ